MYHSQVRNTTSTSQVRVSSACHDIIDETRSTEASKLEWFRSCEHFGRFPGFHASEFRFTVLCSSVPCCIIVFDTVKLQSICKYNTQILLRSKLLSAQNRKQIINEDLKCAVSGEPITENKVFAVFPNVVLVCITTFTART